MSDAIRSLWPAVADHVWQSTMVVAIVAAGLALLRRVQPRVRYRLWLAASLKFLVPLSLFVAVGAQVGRDIAPPIAPTPAIARTVERVSQPFSVTPIPAATSVQMPADPLPAAPRSVVPVVLVAIWAIGVVALVLSRARSWRRITAAVRSASPAVEGRELVLLREVERALDVRKPTRLLISDSTLEPIAVGFLTPALLWPAALTGRLSDAQVRAILSHEVSHLRRRDNLTAAFHIVVETIFWFHPLVWWLSNRLVDERERACDEAVFLVNEQPTAFAEGLLTVGRLCVESPVRFAAGVTGSNLARRIAGIMADDRPRRLRWIERLLLAGACIVTLAGPIAAGALSSGHLPADTALQTLIAPTATLQAAAEEQITLTTAVVGPVQASRPSLRASRSIFDLLPRFAAATLSAPAQAAPPLLVPPDPGGTLVEKGDEVLIEHGPTSPWGVSVKAGGPIDLAGLSPSKPALLPLGTLTFEGLTTRQIEWVLRQRLAASGAITATDWLTITVNPPQQNQAPRPAAEIPFADVFVNGAVRTPGQLHLLGRQMTLQNALGMAGGFTAESGSDIWILRPQRPGTTDRAVTLDDPSAEKIKFSRKTLDTIRDPALKNGDSIFVPKAELFFVNGEVKAGGAKTWEPEMNVGKAVALSSGMTDKASLGRSYIRRFDTATQKYVQIKDLKLETPILPRDELIVGKR